MRLPTSFSVVYNVGLLVCLSALTACGSSSTAFESESDKELFQKYSYSSPEEAISSGQFFDYADAKALMLAGYSTREAFEADLRKRLESDFTRNNRTRLFGTSSCIETRKTYDDYARKLKDKTTAEKWESALSAFCGSGEFEPDAPYRWISIGDPKGYRRLGCSRFAEFNEEEWRGGRFDLWHSSQAFNTLFAMLPALQSQKALSDAIQKSESLIVKNHLNVVDNYCGETGDAHKAFLALSAFDRPAEARRIVQNFRNTLPRSNDQYLKFRTRANLSVRDGLTEGALIFKLKDIPYALFSHEGYCRFSFEKLFDANIQDVGDGHTLSLGTKNEDYGRALEMEVRSFNPGEVDYVMFHSPSVWLTIYAIVSGLEIRSEDDSAAGDCRVLLHAQAIEVGSVNPSDPQGFQKKILYFSKDIIAGREEQPK